MLTAVAEGLSWGTGELCRIVISDLEFQIQGSGGLETHYGWAQVSVSATFSITHNNLQTTTSLSGFAYETVPGKAITTGQTSAQPTIDSP